MSQEDPAEQPSAGGAGEERRQPGLARRLGALWSVPTYRFAALFFAFLAGIAMIYPELTIRFSHYFAAAEAFTAEMVYRLMSLFSSEVELTKNNTVFFGPFPVTIIDECTGISEALLLSAALLAYPTSWHKVAIGFAIGFPLIYAMNIARISMLLVVGRYFSPYFEFMHLYFWQGTMILMVASTWLVWVIWVVRGEGAPDALRSASP